MVGLTSAEGLTLTRVNFINVLRAAFTSADPESAKKDSQVVSLFWHFRNCSCKSSTKNVDEIDPRGRGRGLR